MKNVSCTTSIDDNPVMTAWVALEGCKSHDNTSKHTCPTSTVSAIHAAMPPTVSTSNTVLGELPLVV